jgi:hypothetical protein
MKFSFLPFSLLWVSVASLSLVNGAQAAEDGSARFRYAKNSYAEEQEHQRNFHRYSNSLPVIRHGDMPHSSSFLDPSLLVSPSRPQVSFVPVTVGALKPPTFNKAFGKPVALPATAMALPELKPAVRSAASHSVRVKLSSHVHPKVSGADLAQASSLPLSHSYGAGYQPGSTLPAGGANLDFSANVKGIVIPAKL